MLAVLTASIFPAISLAAPKRQSDCYIPRYRHHSPSRWLKHAQALLNNGATRSPLVGNIKVYHGTEERYGQIAQATVIAVYVIECQKWLFAKYREGRFVTNYFPGGRNAGANTTWSRISWWLQRDFLNYVQLWGYRLVRWAQGSWSTWLYMVPLPACDPWQSPYYDLCVGSTARG